MEHIYWKDKLALPDISDFPMNRLGVSRTYQYNGSRKDIVKEYLDDPDFEIAGGASKEDMTDIINRLKSGQFIFVGVLHRASLGDLSIYIDGDPDSCEWTNDN